MAIDIAAKVGAGGARRRRAVRLSAGDRVTVAVMVGVPMLVVGGLIWFPTIASILLSFTNWDGIGGITRAHWIGTQNYHQIATIFPPFVLSFAIIGFIWELIYSPSQGLINNLIGDPTHGHVIDWLGNPSLNL